MKFNSGVEDMDMDMRCNNPKAQRGTDNWLKVHARFHINVQEFLFRRQQEEWRLRMSSSQRANAMAREAMKGPVVLETDQLLAEKEMHTKEKWNKPVYSEDWLVASTVLGSDNPFHPVRESLQHFLSLQEKAEASSEMGSGGPSDYGSKGRKVFEEEKGISTWKIALRPFGIPLIASFIFLVAVTWWIFNSTLDYGVRGAVREAFQSGAPVTAEQGNQSVDMTMHKATMAKGAVEVPLDVVKKHKLVSFEYKGVAEPVPLLAYVTPSDKIVTTAGMSEPCQSTSFHIEGNELACNLCGTRWGLDTLRGTSGDCAAHPMSILTRC